MSSAAPDLQQVQTVSESPAADAAPEPVVEPVPPATAGDGVEERVVNLVSEKTDYPPDMLDLDLDLEADLGVDTVKQAEVFAEIRAAYDIPRDENLQLREFPTLAHVVGTAPRPCGRWTSRLLRMPRRWPDPYRLPGLNRRRHLCSPRPLMTMPTAASVLGFWKSWQA
jgi:hypothetical protein